MKKILTAIVLTAGFAFATAQSITFDKTTFDYGTVKNGADGHRMFTVKNMGDKPLIISNVKASCGCTTPEWTKDPIMPGKSTQIKVGYNTTITGPFVKTIEVFSNDPENSRSVINIKGTVLPADETAAVEVKAVNGGAALAAEKELAIEKENIEKKQAQLKAAKREAKKTAAK